MCQLLAALLALFCCRATAQVLLSDSFEGSVIDSEKWNVIFPNENSNISLQEGILGSFNRGVVISKNVFSNSYIVSGTFKKSQLLEAPSFVLMADGQVHSSGALVGFNLVFSDYLQFLSYPEVDSPPNNNGLDLVEGPTFYPFIDYDFQINITDDLIEIYVDGNQLISLGNQFPRKYGHIAFFNLGDNFSELLDIQVSVPEPCSLSLLLAGGAVLAAARRRRLV